MATIIGDDAVEDIVKLLNDTDLPNLCKKKKAYKYEKENGIDGEYIAVNHLPFVYQGDVENGIININIHVPQTKTNQVPTRRLKTLTKAIIQLFPKDTYINGSYYELYSISRPVLDNDKTYYVNIQLKIYYNNLNY